jgi:hypothetical protein
MLAYDAKERISAREGLQHAYFKEIRDLEARRYMLPLGTCC